MNTSKLVRREAAELLEEAAVLAEEYLKACMGCHFCTSLCVPARSLGGPLYTPPRRLQAAYNVLVRGRWTSGDLESLYTCTMCGACTTVCPAGIEVWRVVLAARMKLSLEGAQPGSLQAIAENMLRGGHSFTPNPEQPQRVLVEAARRAGAAVDEPAELLYVPSPFETTLYPDVLAKSLSLLASHTSVAVSREALDFGGNAAFDAARPDVGLQALERAVEAAEKLGARVIVLSGCGSDTKLARLASHYRWARVRVVTLYELLASKAKASTSDGGARLHASCGYARFEPHAYPTLERLSATKPARDKPPYTMCCGGGGGVNYLREQPLAKLKQRMYTWRIRRLAEEKTTTVITPCIKCYTVFRQAALLAKLHTKLRVRHLTQTLSPNTPGSIHRKTSTTPDNHTG